MVVDASVLANVVGGDGAEGRRARGEIRSAGDVAAPDLVAVETVAALRNAGWPARSRTAGSRQQSLISERSTWIDIRPFR